MLSDIEPGGGALHVIPGSHKREVPWRPAGVPLNHKGNTRLEDCAPSQRAMFEELTGKAGTAVIFVHDLIHASWHETDTYRRVVHMTFSSQSAAQGSDDDDTATVGGHDKEGKAVMVADEDCSDEEWLRYLLRERENFRLPPPGVNLNYAADSKL